MTIHTVGAIVSFFALLASPVVIPYACRRLLDASSYVEIAVWGATVAASALLIMKLIIIVGLYVEAH